MSWGVTPVRITFLWAARHDISLEQPFGGAYAASPNAVVASKKPIRQRSRYKLGPEIISIYQLFASCDQIKDLLSRSAA